MLTTLHDNFIETAAIYSVLSLVKILPILRIKIHTIYSLSIGYWLFLTLCKYVEVVLF